MKKKHYILLSIGILILLAIWQGLSWKARQDEFWKQRSIFDAIYKRALVAEKKRSWNEAIKYYKAAKNLHFLKNTDHFYFQFKLKNVSEKIEECERSWKRERDYKKYIYRLEKSLRQKHWENARRYYFLASKAKGGAIKKYQDRFSKTKFAFSLPEIIMIHVPASFKVKANNTIFEPKWYFGEKVVKKAIAKHVFTKPGKYTVKFSGSDGIREIHRQKDFYVVSGWDEQIIKAGFSKKTVKEITLVHKKGKFLNMACKTWFKLSFADKKKIASLYQKAYAYIFGKPVLDVFFINAFKIELMFIPPGQFMMGSHQYEKDRKDDEHWHKVLIDTPFYIGKYEVTQGIWQEVMKKNPARFKGKNNPVEQVSWTECQVFLKKLGCQFPTEQQWEYACRAGTTTPFNLGENITTAQVNYDGNVPYNGAEDGIFRGKTVPVGSLGSPNFWGCHDFHGNVWEWCANWKADYKTGEKIKNPIDPKQPYRVFRGGTWSGGALFARSAFRSSYSPRLKRSYLGLRLVKKIK